MLIIYQHRLSLFFHHNQQNVAPDKSVAFVLATKLKEGINISSFVPTFNKYKAKCSAAVPLTYNIFGFSIIFQGFLKFIYIITNRGYKATIYNFIQNFSRVFKIGE